VRRNGSHAGEPGGGGNAVDGALEVAGSLRALTRAYEAGDADMRDPDEQYLFNIGTFQAGEWISNAPSVATLGLRVEPAPIGSGVEFRLDVDVHSVPLYMFKRRDDFAEAMAQYVREALHAGLFGWQVTDCVVTLTRSEYGGADGPPSKRGQLSTAGDFRKLTPLVLRQALKRAGTVVCEPTVRARVETPAESIGTVLPVLARLGTVVETPSIQGRLATIETVLPAARAHDLQQQLASLTRGEGVLESRFAGYEPVSGAQPRRGGFGG